MKSLLFTVLAFLALASVAQATDYYVTKAGSDAAACTIGAPCLTITHGITKLSGGDTLYIGAGTYDEHINAALIPNGTGNATRTRILSIPGQQVIIMPSAVSGTSVVDFGNSLVKNWIEFNGGQNCGPTSGGATCNMILDGTNVVSPDDSQTSNNTYFGISANLRFTNLELRNTGVAGGTTGNPENGFQGGGSNVEISNCNVHDNGKKADATWTAGAYGWYVSGGSGHVVDNCYVHHNGGYGLHVYHNADPTAITGAVIKNSHIYSNGVAAVTVTIANVILSSCTNCTLFNNVIRDGGINSHGIQVSGNCTNCSVYNNTVYHNTRSGIVIEASATGTIVKNNIFKDNNQAGASWPNFEDNGISSTKSNNLCHGTGGTASPCNLTTDPNFTDASTNNFNLLTGSPGIDSGADLSAFFVVDSMGITRPQNSVFDLGAFEVVSGGVAPTVTITSPTSSATYGATSATISVSGTSNQSGGSVAYTCDRCTSTSGSATGTATWSLPTLTLKSGINIITVTHTNATLNAGSDVLTVTYQPTFPGNSLVLAMPFEEGSGTSAADVSGNSNNGTLIAAPTWVGASLGRYGNALSFNGTTQYITVADSNSLDMTQTFSISLWVKPSAFNVDYRQLVGKIATPLGSPYRLFASVGGECGIGGVSGFARTNGASGPQDQACYATPLPIGTWTHVAITYDGNNLRLYTQGTLRTTTSLVGFIEPSTGLLYIANSEFGEFFQGAIDELRIYNYAIPVSALSNTTFGNTCTRADNALPGGTPSVIGDANCPITAPTPPVSIKISASATGLKLGGTTTTKFGSISGAN